jgi:5-methyltetrahydrofolate--homocysteine methyltransferase
LSLNKEFSLTEQIDRRLRNHIVDRHADDIEALLEQALVARPLARHDAALEIVREVLLPLVHEAVAAYASEQMLLPVVLERAEIVWRAMQYLQADFARGTIVVATPEGDVHHIGRALLVSMLRVSGYRVYDLGERVPVHTIVDAAVERHADAIGLSALLVTTSKQMPRCVEELDRRGLKVPVLVGGAAISRHFGDRVGILPDGRVYEGGVFYCKDVFEGVRAMDALVDPTRAGALVEATRAEIATERDQPPIAVSPAPGSVTRLERAEIPRPVELGARRRAATLDDVWRHLDRNSLFRYHWGGFRASAAEYAALVRDVFEPRLAAFMRDAQRDGWLEPLIVSGAFACASDGDALVVFDPIDPRHELTRLDFPRQPDADRLCLTDYFRPLASPERDVVVFQAVSVGSRAGDSVEELLAAGEFSRMLFVNGFASATAEALADYAHVRAREELGLSEGRGLRFSWGYLACPDLSEQRKVLPLLAADNAIGLSLSSSDTLDPEHSTVAMIVHHPQAKYFAVRQNVQAT